MGWGSADGQAQTKGLDSIGIFENPWRLSRFCETLDTYGWDERDQGAMTRDPERGEPS